jgi:hypothetical protein
VSPHSTPPPVRDSKTDLLDAARAVIKDRNEKAEQLAASRMHPAVRRRVSILTVVGFAGAILLLLQPTWLAGPDAPPVETPAIVEASLRLSMLRERQRVTDFALKQGRLPTSLAEAGSTAPGLGYEALPEQTFRLFAQAGDSLLVLSSTDSMSHFLGNSLKEIKNRGRP